MVAVSAPIMILPAAPGGMVEPVTAELPGVPDTVPTEVLTVAATGDGAGAAVVSRATEKDKQEYRSRLELYTQGKPYHEK